MSAHFYLVSTGSLWKWGITTKQSYKKRSGSYVDCFVWQEIEDMATGRALERCVGAIMTNILKEEEQAARGRGNCRCIYTEDVGQDFPLHLLMEIVDYVLNGIKSGESGEEYKYACPGLGFWDDPIPALSAAYKQKLHEWRSCVPEVRQPEPMWA